MMTTASSQRQLSAQRFLPTALATALLLLLVANHGRCSVLRNASTTTTAPNAADPSALPDVVPTTQLSSQPAAATSTTSPPTSIAIDLSADDDDDDEDDFDDESFMSGTEKADVPPADVTNSTTSSICSEGRCGTNKSCVEDPDFKDGYRCCKKKPCSKSAGRYCDDPGTMGVERRTPTVRKRRKFKPGERIFFYCESAGYEMVCQDNGTWRQDPEKNPCEDPLLPTTPIPMPEPEPYPPGGVRRGGPVAPKRSNGNATEKLSIVVIVVSSCIVVFLIYLSIRYGRKRCEQSLVKNPEKPQRRPQPAPMPDLMSSSVSIDDFQSYVNDRHSGSDFLFLQEFQTIQNESSSQQYTTEASNLMENVEKNRYNNIVAYDHTRVHLKELKKQNTPFDYINANYVSGFTNLQAFIACQGPLPSTFSDFWEMVWNNNVNVIVMITNLIENGRRKCDQYWPTEGKEAYKYITVSAKTTETYANYTIRTFMLKNNKLTKRPATERRVVQYHYTQWPDHGTPDYVLPVLSFISKSSSGDQTAPIVVHCSAGVGRTGTYIAIQSMIQMLKTSGSVNIPTFLRHIRTQRNHLVQTQDQYVFVHDAVMEYIKVGSTEIKRKELLSYYSLLLKSINNESSSGSSAAAAGDTSMTTKKQKNTIEKQFDHMKRHLEVLVDNNFATRTVNRNKNRQGALLPVFKSCVRLRDNNSAEEGSEYINASYLQGYRNSAEFIITQLPIESTRKDFWQLVWDVNCSVIVTLGDDEWDDADDNYWPTQETPSQFSSFKVTFSQEEQTGDIIQRTFVLEATKDDYVLMVKQFHIRCWNEIRPSRDNAEVVAMVSTYAATKEGSTIIQDRFGSTSAAQFACWTSIHDRLENDDCVDVYQTAVLACQMRPGVFTSFNHLLYLYEAAVMEAKVTDNHRRSATSCNNSPPDLLPTPDPPRRDCINCTTAGEEAVTLLTFNHETA